MFTIKAGHTKAFSINADVSTALAFFEDAENFDGILPNLKRVRKNSGGNFVWTIHAQVPVIGAFEQNFVVREDNYSDDSVEWIPAENEIENLLRCSAALESKTKGETNVNFSLYVELRRRSAMALNMLAGIAGERAISNGMTSELVTMLDKFAENVRVHFEK
ncbi:MAG: hypothetical protein ACK5NT_02410 [Pyrinomonadaceae bacterium]